MFYFIFVIVCYFVSFVFRKHQDEEQQWKRYFLAICFPVYRMEFYLIYIYFFFFSFVINSFCSVFREISATKSLSCFLFLFLNFLCVWLFDKSHQTMFLWAYIVCAILKKLSNINCTHKSISFALIFWFHLRWYFLHLCWSN